MKGQLKKYPNWVLEKIEMKKVRQSIRKENPQKGQILSNPSTGDKGREELCLGKEWLGFFSKTFMIS